MLHVHEMIEAVTPYPHARAHILQHQPQLVAAQAGTQATELMHHADDLLPVQLTLQVFIHGVVVVSPAALPVQPADRLHAQARMTVPEAYCCREPAFFNMSTPSCLL